MSTVRAWPEYKDLQQSMGQDRPWITDTEPYFTSIDASITTVISADATLLSPAGATTSVSGSEVTIDGMVITVMVKKELLTTTGLWTLHVRGHVSETIADSSDKYVINVIA